MKQLSVLALALFVMLASSTMMMNFISASNTTEPVTTVATTVVTNTTAAATPSPPPPSNPCNTLSASNCSLNGTCATFNGTCRETCYTIGFGGEYACGNASYCTYSNYMCKTNCHAIMNHPDGCQQSQDCLFFEGHCNANQCNGFTMNECEVNRQCMFDNSSNMCKVKCSAAMNRGTCLEVFSWCQWWAGEQVCRPTCTGRPTGPSDCDVSGYCNTVRTTSRDWDVCEKNCSWIQSWNDCTAEINCMWDNATAKCIKTCDSYGTDVIGCRSNPACWVNGAGKCVITRCDMIQTVDSCRKSGPNCQVIDGTTCASACSLISVNASLPCPAAPYCNNSGNSCVATPCSASTTESTCAYRHQCAWTGGMCKVACDFVSKESDCTGLGAHCTWDSFTWKCLPACPMYSSRSACESTPSNGNCAWTGYSCQLKCESTTNMTLCGSLPNCQVKTLARGRQVCRPYCDIAQPRSTCDHNPFFTQSCEWGTTYCRESCYGLAQSQCTSPCMFDSEFNVCVNARRPTPNTTMAPMPTNETMPPMPTNSSNGNGTMPPMPTQGNGTMPPGGNGTMPPMPTQGNGTMPPMPTNSSNGNGTFPPRPTTTAPANSTAAQTTAAPTTTTAVQSTEAPTTTMAPSTAAPTTSTARPATTTNAPTPSTAKPQRRNRRVRFVLTAIAKARSNTTAANFKQLLRQMLNIPANSFTVAYDAAQSEMVVEFIEDDNTNTNTTADVEAATNLNPTQLSQLGAAAVETMEPAPAPTQAPADDKPDLALIIGAACGGFIFLLIILFIIKKSSAAGTGAAAASGDQAMLEVPERQMPNRGTIDNEL